MNEYLEMWKTQRIMGNIDCYFDTLFLVFLWIMRWDWLFGFYIGVAVISLIGNAIKLKNLEKEIK